MEKNIYRLGEIFTRFSSGKNIIDKNISLEGNYPVFGGNGVRGFTNQNNFEGECIIIGRQGAKCGNVRYFNGEAYMTDHAIVGVCNGNHSARYISYALAELNLNRLSGQSAQPGLSVSMLKKQKIILPLKKTQIKISKIISAYDELIENNNKRIKLLEQMAENLYKEWFVRFRFPGYKNAEFENGIPKGWEYVRFGNIICFERGISYTSEEIDSEEGVDLINLKNVQSFGGFRKDGTKKYKGKYKNSQTVVEGDLVMGMTDMTQDRRTVGSVALIPYSNGVSVISADIVKIVSNINNYYLYCMCRYGNYSRFFSQFANGANVLHLKPSSLINKKVMIASNKIIDDFVRRVSCFIKMIDKLNLQNDNLIKQRDLLLPRLMSGKLEV